MDSALLLQSVSLKADAAFKVRAMRQITNINARTFLFLIFSPQIKSNNFENNSNFIML